MKVQPLEVINIVTNLFLDCTDDQIDDHAEIKNVTNTFNSMVDAGELMPYLYSLGVPEDGKLDAELFGQLVWAVTYALSIERSKV